MCTMRRESPPEAKPCTIKLSWTAVLETEKNGMLYVRSSTLYFTLKDDDNDGNAILLLLVLLQQQLLSHSHHLHCQYNICTYILITLVRPLSLSLQLLLPYYPVHSFFQQARRKNYNKCISLLDWRCSLMHACLLEREREYFSCVQ